MLLPRPVALKAWNRKPPELGPKVRVEVAHLSPAADASGLKALVNGAGLRDWDKDGFKEQDTAPRTMWLGACAPNLSLEFELPEAVPLGALEVWNFNGEWQTTNGVRKADVAVSADGTTWQTVLRGAEFAEAYGYPDYDEPIVLKLNGATARKVRFENIVPWGTGDQVGLSEVVFRQAAGPQAGPLQPEDGSEAASCSKPVLRWVAGAGAKEHRVCLGTECDKLAPLGTTSQASFEPPPLKSGTTYFWRVDEVQSDGRVVTGRVARFQTVGLVAWYKLDEAKGNKAEDASGRQAPASVVGKANWAAEQGRCGGALEFDGKTTFVNCGKAPEFDFAEAMTVAAWIKVRQFDKPWQAILTKGDTAWRLQREGSTGKVAFCFNRGPAVERGNQNSVAVISKRAVDDGQWHHVVGVTDGTRAALFVDGELEGSAKAAPIAQNNQSVMIGCNAQFYERRFNGWIDDVRLYGYALSEAEIKALYQGAGQGK